MDYDDINDDLRECIFDFFRNNSTSEVEYLVQAIKNRENLYIFFFDKSKKDKTKCK